MVKKDIEIQPGFELGSSEFRSQNPHLQGPTGNISTSEEKPCKVLLPALGSDIERYFYLCFYFYCQP